MQSVNNAVSSTDSTTRSGMGNSNPDVAGDSGREPISGETGRGTADRPFDRGNEDDPTRGGAPGSNQQLDSNRGTAGNTSSYGDNSSYSGSTMTGGNPSGDNPSSTNTGPHDSNVGNQLDPRVDSDRSGSGSGTPNTAPRTYDQRDTSTGLSTAQGSNQNPSLTPEHTTDKTGVISGLHSSDKPHQGDVQNPSSTSASAPSSGTAPAGSVGVADSSVSADPNSAQKPTPKQQGADRPFEAPGQEGTDAVRREKEETERTAAAGKTDRSASLTGDTGGNASGHGPGPIGGANKKDDGHGPQSESHGEGTGEKWVKTSGMAAEGGDFDAAKPGAGREADRLLEQKGIHREPPSGSAIDDAMSTPDRSSKPGMGEKIKEKLHLGGH
ncbi:MAG: hypothetical protein M1817_005720 [Caeruleum heppii]|nr:MAG: hypothetical protein M1817_005720 [Caeruleum heppii]